jgi:hypothetical protein
MPVNVTFHNSIFDMKCSKCRRTKEPGFFITNDMLYKTCNVCRAHARRNSRAAIDERMAAAAANDDDDDNAVHSLIGLGFDTVDVDVDEDEVPANTTAIMAAIREGRRLAGIQRREDRWRRFNMAGEYDAFADFNTLMNNARSSSAAASSSNDSSGYFVDEPDPEPEPGL